MGAHQLEAIAGGQADQVGDVSNAPAGVTPSQRPVEAAIALRTEDAVHGERAVDEQQPRGWRQKVAGALEEALGALPWADVEDVAGVDHIRWWAGGGGGGGG